MRHLILTTLVSLITAEHARAEFVLITAQPTRVADAMPQLSPSAPAKLNFQSQAKTAPNSEKPRFKMAFGFGKSVPLAFACRQIVPRAVKIIYGPGADQTTLVDWKGGDTWNRVLHNAVQPLGLHLVMITMAVEIRR